MMTRVYGMCTEKESEAGYAQVAFTSLIQR